MIADDERRHRLIALLLALPGLAKRAITLDIDVAICAGVDYLAFYLRQGLLVDPFIGSPYPAMMR